MFTLEKDIIRNPNIFLFQYFHYVRICNTEFTPTKPSFEKIKVI